MHRPEPNPPRRASLVPSLLALALFAALLAPSLAQGRCMSGNLTVWPPPETALPTSPLILIEGFGDQQPQVAALAADGSAELVAATRRDLDRRALLRRASRGVRQGTRPTGPRTRNSRLLDLFSPPLRQARRRRQLPNRSDDDDGTSQQSTTVHAGTRG